MGRALSTCVPETQNPEGEQGRPQGGRTAGGVPCAGAWLPERCCGFCLCGSWALGGRLMPARVEGSWVSVTGLFHRKNLRDFVRSMVLRPSLSSPGFALPWTWWPFPVLTGLLWRGERSAPYGFPGSQRPAPCPLAWRLLGGLLRAPPAGRGRAPCPVSACIVAGCGSEPLFPVSQNDEVGEAQRVCKRAGASWCRAHASMHVVFLALAVEPSAAGVGGGREPEVAGRCDGVLCSRLLSPRWVRRPCGGCRHSWGPAGVPSACLSGSPLGAENGTPSAMGTNICLRSTRAWRCFVHRPLTGPAGPVWMRASPAPGRAAACPSVREPS